MNTTVQEVVDTEPLKVNLEHLADKSDSNRRLLFLFLRIFMLRTWYISREIKFWGRSRKGTCMHILDAGSGYGQNAFFISNYCPKWSILGVDLKKNEVSGCNHFFQHAGKQNVTFKYKDLTQMRMQESFDLILSVETLTYIEDDDQVLRNYHHSLKAGGTIILWCPVCDKSKKVKELYYDSNAPHRVRNGYNPEKLISKLDKLGFVGGEYKKVYGRAGLLSRRLYALWPTRLLNISKVFSLILPFYYLVALPICLGLNIWDFLMPTKEGAFAIVKAFKPKV